MEPKIGLDVELKNFLTSFWMFFRFDSAKVRTMDVGGISGHLCDRDRGVGRTWIYDVRCGWKLFGIRMAEAFGSSQVGIMAKSCRCIFHFDRNCS